MKNRALLQVVIARFLGRTGGEAAFFVGVWGLAAYRFHGSPAQLAGVMFAISVTMMVGSAISGALIDRFGPRAVLVGGEMLYVPAALAMTRVESLPQLVVLAAVFGLASAPVMTATASFAPYLESTPGGIEKANAVIDATGSASFVIGPGLGAIVSARFGLDAVFYLDAAMAVLCALMVLGVPLRRPTTHVPGHPVRQFIEGVSTAYRLRGVRYYVIIGSLLWFGFGAFGALEPLFYRDVVGTGIETIGWMNSIFGVGLVAGAAMLPRLPGAIISARGVTVTAALVGLSTSVYVMSPDLRVIAVGALVFGTSIGLAEPLLRTLMQLDTPPEFVGRVMGTAQVHRSAGELIPLALAPLLAAAFGVQAVLIAGGVLVAFAVALSWGEASQIDREAGGPRRGGGSRVPSSVLDDPVSPVA